MQTTYKLTTPYDNPDHDIFRSWKRWHEDRGKFRKYMEANARKTPFK